MSTGSDARCACSARKDTISFFRARRRAEPLARHAACEGPRNLSSFASSQSSSPSAFSSSRNHWQRVLRALAHLELPELSARSVGACGSSDVAMRQQSIKAPWRNVQGSLFASCREDTVTPIHLTTTTWGSGSPRLVLIHGMGDGAFVWDELVSQLRVTTSGVTVDLRGHGDSPWDSLRRYNAATCHGCGSPAAGDEPHGPYAHRAFSRSRHRHPPGRCCRPSASSASS